MSDASSTLPDPTNDPDPSNDPANANGPGTANAPDHAAATTTTTPPAKQLKQSKTGASYWQRLIMDQEKLLLALILIILGVVIIQVPTFWSIETLFNILRGSMVDVLFALGVLVVLISGGIDVSFLAIGITAGYIAVSVTPAGANMGYAALAFAIAALIGIGLGLINAIVVLGAKVSTLIATLATYAIFMGCLFALGGGIIINRLPESLYKLSQTNLIVAPGAVRGTTRLNILILLVLSICILMWLFLTWTIPGRAVFALGGGEVAAARAAIPVVRTRVMVFVLAGALAGIAGLTAITLAGRADPVSFLGKELNIIAAVVLGGALITGGKGTVRGTALGVVLISLIQTSLVPLGVPAIYQQMMVGILLIFGVVLQAIGLKMQPERSILVEKGETNG